MNSIAKAPRGFTVTWALIAFTLLNIASLSAASSESQIVSREIRSEKIACNKIGSNPVRQMAIYLPAIYNESSQRFPVIYYLPTPFSNYRTIFDQRAGRALFDQAIAKGTIEPFILVTVDLTTPIGCSWYVNSPATGNWEDFVVQELVPYIDASFKTIPTRDSRGIAGDFMGGYGAIRFGMKYPQVFGSVYALHPVGTGSGVQTMASRPVWDVLINAKTLNGATHDGFSQIFTAIFQAHLPNPDKPPLYIDIPVHKVGDQFMIDTQLTEKLRSHFLLETLIPQYADNLKSLRGFKFDWSRSDVNEDHIYSNQAFTHKLNEFGIPHEAEEYNGVQGDPNWGQDGRIMTDLIPFFQRHLVFAAAPPSHE